ncbi:MAG: hypoxanthine phosphoribosyltransferase [Deltaproteobacteria bacterium]|jgi:hypoxanthine phosphoribosyltransferase|nr:hypoxanthine phosphoribosyltransferase [Deltaproteobacteria bacterium]
MPEPKKPVSMELVLDPAAIKDMVARLGREINDHYADLVREDDRLLVMGILNGAFIFMADLVRVLTIPLEVDFIRLSSYEDNTASSERVVMLKAPERILRGRHILIVEDIADCGLTLNWFKGYLEKEFPESVRIAVAVDKKERRRVPLKPDFTGFEIEEGYLVGYGLDYAQGYRNLEGIHRLVF